MSRLTLVLLAMLLMGGCAEGEQLPQEPHLEGLIYAIHGDSILVVEGIANADIPQEEWQGKRAISFAITENTKIYDQEGNEISMKQLEKEQIVSAWHTGSVEESYPEQAQAVLIIVR